MEFILGLYLVGYFISFGIAFAFRKDSESWIYTFFSAILFSFMPWINIGLAIGDVCKYLDAEQKADRYEKALFEIQFKATSAIFPHLPVETLGAQMCIEIEKVATEALTPKQTTDE